MQLQIGYGKEGLGRWSRKCIENLMVKKVKIGFCWVKKKFTY